MDFYDEKAKQWGVTRDEAKRRFLKMAYSAKPEELRKAAKTEFEDAIAFLVRSEIEHQQPGALVSGFHGRWENLSLSKTANFCIALESKLTYNLGVLEHSMNERQHKKLVMDLTRQALANEVPAQVFADVWQNLTALNYALTRAFMREAEYKGKSWKHPKHFDNDFAKFKRNAIKNLLERD